MCESAPITGGVPDGERLSRRLDEILSSVLDISLEAAAADPVRSQVPSWDSMTHLRLVMELEDAFGIVLDDAEIVDIESVGAVRFLVRRRLAVAAD